MFQTSSFWMHQQSGSGVHPEIQNILRERIDMIKYKRTAQIKLSAFPPNVTLAEIFEALSEICHQYGRLERIILSGNELTTLPREFQLVSGPSLRYLDLHNNHFAVVPSILGSTCPNLEGLDISENYLSVLPSSVFLGLPDLKVLLIRRNNFAYLDPFLGEMINLEAINASENPLILPSIDLIKNMQGGTNDLKAYLLSNSAVLEQHIQHQIQQQKQSPSTPNISRTRSFSDTRSKSLKASRRMGFIVNNSKPVADESNGSLLSETSTPSKPERKLLLPTYDRSDFLALAQPQMDGPWTPSTLTASTASNSRSASPPTISVVPSTSRPNSRNRSRSNTLRNVDSMLETSDLADSNQKSGAYFRRLSTLQERPADEAFRASQEELIKNEMKSDSLKTVALQIARDQDLDISPSRPITKKLAGPPPPLQNTHSTANSSSLPHTIDHSQCSHDISTTIKVARKMLFSFSEVHLSVKRFTGFCSDKKILMRVVPLLHTTKGNIDSLVETLEAVEDQGENQALIMDAVQTCIISFKQIFTLISDNFTTFVSKIDVCFVRMVYLTLFGSFNEMQNAFKLLTQIPTPQKSLTLSRNQSYLALNNTDTKLRPAPQSLPEENASIVQDTNNAVSSAENNISAEEIDKKLYQAIALATADAQTVFSQLTNSMNKSAIASANSSSGPVINLAVSTKFKELTSVCISSMEITKRLIGMLSTIRTNQAPLNRKLFWDDINLFLKAIIQTFSSVKAIMKDVPTLNEVRLSMAHLTKTTKDLTLLLEISSYKSMSDSLNSISVNSLVNLNGILLPSVNSASAINLSQMAGSTAVRTPLVATVGSAAAQAILPLSDLHLMNSANSAMPMSITIPPLVSSDVLNTGLHTAPVQSMEQFYAKSVNPFDKL